MIDRISRRSLLGMGAALSASLPICRPAWASLAADGVAPELVARARGALELHKASLLHTDRIGIVDFARPSREPRFHLLDAVNGRATDYLVAHGRGSDPTHTGWVTRLSNEPRSYASSEGAYVTRELYVGAHGRSMRLAGLDAVNSNAEVRALVIHAAWYVSPQIARETGKVGRSEGCFAVSADSLDEVIGQLGPGRLIYASGIDSRVRQSLRG